MPRIVLRLTAGPLAIVNVTFLVPHDALAAENLLLRFPLLNHLGIDTMTMFEKYRDSFARGDCSDKQSDVSGGGIGKVGRLMIAILSLLHCDEQKHVTSNNGRHLLNYFKLKKEEDPFPDSSCIRFT